MLANPRSSYPWTLVGIVPVVGECDPVHFVSCFVLSKLMLSGFLSSLRPIHSMRRYVVSNEGLNCIREVRKNNFGFRVGARRLVTGTVVRDRFSVADRATTCAGCRDVVDCLVKLRYGEVGVEGVCLWDDYNVRTSIPRLTNVPQVVFVRVMYTLVRSFLRDFQYGAFLTCPVLLCRRYYRATSRQAHREYANRVFVVANRFYDHAPCPPVSIRYSSKDEGVRVYAVVKVEDLSVVNLGNYGHGCLIVVDQHHCPKIEDVHVT